MAGIDTQMNGVDAPQHTALQLKELGNADFKAGHYDKAIKHYSNAIGSPTRSFAELTCCRIKLDR
jgi:hypothetical protein